MVTDHIQQQQDSQILPLPRTERHWIDLYRAKWFSTLDLISVIYALFEFNRMPFVWTLPLSVCLTVAWWCSLPSFRSIMAERSLLLGTETGLQQGQICLLSFTDRWIICHMQAQSPCFSSTIWRHSLWHFCAIVCGCWRFLMRTLVIGPNNPVFFQSSEVSFFKSSWWELLYGVLS